ncbi:uncharacterized protein BO80DRAFT_439822 [Aspergillus ibericus CBS 121593]|uniref:Uncharacterized protein n=1 Tax=Aspergillus ibericus CBS 121593 TaxID=1448316 RepID=A0A395GI32_9EURO|nr:hypothetical protein BO80DRAFT_439822 [Aspergillus ibericus CBS 121593]RAK94912.1 hypothetical protein BO80DRAFT_439822 [Aspergillus ibericus CBS 121593]
MSGCAYFPAWEERLTEFFQEQRRSNGRIVQKGIPEDDFHVETTTKQSMEAVVYDTLIMSHKRHGPILVMVCSKGHGKSSDYDRVLMTRECKASVKRAHRIREADVKSDAKVVRTARVYGAVLRGTSLEFHVECSHGRLLSSMEEPHGEGLADSSEDLSIVLTGLRVLSSEKVDLEDSIEEPQMEFPGSLMDVIVHGRRRVFHQNSFDIMSILNNLRKEWGLPLLNSPPIYIKPVVPVNTPALVFPSVMADDDQPESFQRPEMRSRGLSLLKSSFNRGSPTWTHSPTPSELGLTAELDPASESGLSAEYHRREAPSAEESSLDQITHSDLGVSPNYAEDFEASDDNKGVVSMDSDDSVNLLTDIPSRGLRDAALDVSSDDNLSSRWGHMPAIWRRARREREARNDIAPSPSIRGSIANLDEAFQGLPFSGTADGVTVDAEERE